MCQYSYSVRESTVVSAATYYFFLHPSSSTYNCWWMRGDCLLVEDILFTLIPSGVSIAIRAPNATSFHTFFTSPLLSICTYLPSSFRGVLMGDLHDHCHRHCVWWHSQYHLMFFINFQHSKVPLIHYCIFIFISTYIIKWKFVSLDVCSTFMQKQQTNSD